MYWAHAPTDNKSLGKKIAISYLINLIVKHMLSLRNNKQTPDKNTNPSQGEVRIKGSYKKITLNIAETCNMLHIIKWATDEITCFGKMPSPNVGGPLSVFRILDVQGINIKTEACDIQSGMIWFATWSRISGEQAKMREFLLAANADNYKIFECALVHLGYTYYRHL